MKKRSPRAPSLSLSDAIERTQKIYRKEKRHPAPVEAIAQHLGYKNASNGAAASVIASIGYYGLIERPDGKLISVSKDLESYLFAPDDQIKHEILVKWLRTPIIFSELLDQYQDQLPSDENLKFNLINRGFIPDAADACLSVFRKSVEFAQYYGRKELEQEQEGDKYIEPPRPLTSIPSGNAQGHRPAPSAFDGRPMDVRSNDREDHDLEVDRIPVRLPKGRRAWIEIPSPFYNADKERLIAQIQLLLADDEDTDMN